MRKFILVLFLFFNSLALAFAGSNVTDTEITRRVREQILLDPSLSQYARNVKVVTIDGQVLMRGIVFDSDEARRILGKAQSVAGVLEIVSELQPIEQ